MKRLFLNWLKKTSRFKAFFNHAGCYYKYLLNRIDYKSYVASAFPWINTPEGDYYWRKCHFEWEVYYERYLATHPKFYKKYYKPL